MPSDYFAMIIDYIDAADVFADYASYCCAMPCAIIFFFRRCFIVYAVMRDVICRCRLRSLLLSLLLFRHATLLFAFSRHDYASLMITCRFHYADYYC